MSSTTYHINHKIKNKEIYRYDEMRNISHIKE